MQLTFNTNWSRWIGAADWMWVGHEGKLKCYLKFPLNAGLGFRPAPSFMHCLRLACACLLPVPSCQGCVLQLWSGRATPEQGRVLSGTCVPCCGSCPRGLSLWEGGPLGSVWLLWLGWEPLGCSEQPSFLLMPGGIKWLQSVSGG